MVNEVRLIGFLGAEPIKNETTGGTAVVSFSVATNERWKDKEGKEHEDTQWHRVVTFKKQAESCAKCLAKGKQVYVEGKLQTREWEDKDGSRRWTTEVVARRVLFLGKGPGRADDAPPPTDEDIPF